MSFDIYIYDQSAKATKPFNREKPPLIPRRLLDGFKERLLKYSYRLVQEDKERAEYEHLNRKWGIQVLVFPTEISFRVPYWEDSQEAIFEALMTATELCDHGELVVYDPQNGGWTDIQA